MGDDQRSADKGPGRVVSAALGASARRGYLFRNFSISAQARLTLSSLG